MASPARARVLPFLRGLPWMNTTFLDMATPCQVSVRRPRYFAAGTAGVNSTGTQA